MQRTHRLWRAVAALLLICTLQHSSAIAAAAPTDEILVGVFPRRPSLQTTQMFAPLVAQLGKTLDVPTRLDVPPDFPAFWQAVSEGRYQLVHYNPYHYVRSHKEFGYRVVTMNEEFGESHIRAALWVRKDSNIRSAADLRHQKIVFGGGRKAMISYIVNTDLLHQAGLSDTDYIGQFTVNPTHALMAVYYRQGMAAGLNLNASNQPSLSSKVDFGQLKPLLVGEPLALHPWAVSSAVSRELQARIAHALLQLNDSAGGRDALSAAELTGMSPASDRDYDPHREIIQRVLQESY